MTRATLPHAAQLDLSHRASAHVAEARRLSGTAGGKQGRERTSAAALDRLAAQLAAPLPDDTDHARRIQSARAELRQAERLWWDLALSADYVARSEAGHRGGPMPLADRLQEARIGLYRAARIFEPARGVKFATHARWWARAQLSRAIDRTGGPIAVSSTAARLLNDHRKLPPGTPIAEAATAIGASQASLEMALAAGVVDSLNAPLSYEGGRPFALLDVLADESVDVDADLDTAALWRAVERALSTLDDRQRESVLRVVCDGEQLARVGKRFGLSRERIRQIVSGACVDLAIAVRAERRGPRGRPPALVVVSVPVPVEVPPEPAPRPARITNARRLEGIVNANPGILLVDACRRLGIPVPHKVTAKVVGVREGRFTRLYPLGWSEQAAAGAK